MSSGEFPKIMAAPFLQEFKKAVLELRQSGSDQQTIDAALPMSEKMVRDQVEDPDDCAWLIQQFWEAAMPPHAGTGVVQ